MHRLVAFMAALPCAADPATDIEAAALALLPDLPPIKTVEAIAGACGATHEPDEGTVACFGPARIMMTEAARSAPDAAYRAAHAYAHAIKVETGLADLALRTIRARPDDEEALRAEVTEVVECVAGRLAASAGHPGAFPADGEPFTDAHWGADLGRGPEVSIGREARLEAFRRGAEGADYAICATDLFGPDLLPR